MPGLATCPNMTYEETQLGEITYQKVNFGCLLVAHTCNPSSLGI
jgi:hypothetical protein